MSTRFPEKSEKSERNQIMKIKIVCLGLTLASSLVSATAQAVVTSYADVFPATPERVAYTDSNREVAVTAVSSVVNISFSTMIKMPPGTTSFKFTTTNDLSFSVTRKTGSSDIVVIEPSSMSSFKYGATGFPKVVVLDGDKNPISPTVATNIVGYSVTGNISEVWIYDQKFVLGTAKFPYMTSVGDSYSVFRSLSYEITVNGNPSGPLFVVSQPASVQIVPVPSGITGPTIVSEDNVSTPKTVISRTATNDVINVTGFGDTWWSVYTIQTSVDFGSWSPVDLSTVSATKQINGSWDLAFEINPVELQRFWRLKR